MTKPTHVNKLSPAELERLAMLAEEAAEVIHIVNKIIRHGYGSTHPQQPYVSNRSLLEQELTDLRAVIAIMIREADVKLYAADILHRSNHSKLKYTYYQGHGHFS